MYLSIVITFILILVLIVAGIQNSMSIDLNFLTWKLRISLLGLVFYSSLIGGAIIAVLTIPKLVSKSLRVGRLNREVYDLKKKVVDLEKGREEES